LPGYGPTRAAAIRDLQIAVGARRIHTQSSTELEDQLSSFKLEDLGECAEARISQKRTVLIGGNGTMLAINARVKDLIRQQQEAGNPFDREQLDHRIARLTKGVAMLKVGAYSEPAMDEKKARAEDAVFACRGALEQGVVVGGGVALLRAAQAERQAFRNGPNQHFPRDFRLGFELLLDAMEVPCQQILANAGSDDRGIIEQFMDKVVPAWRESSFKIAASSVREIKATRKGESFGFDAGKGRYCDLFDAGVVDPTKVVLVALEKASSIGALLLTTEALITDLPTPQLAQSGAYGNGQRADFRA
jgi:chaperonin GroEL